ncbi:hypothetical protein RI367_004592 [Sorochytrium milnesiophthora]
MSQETAGPADDRQALLSYEDALGRLAEVEKQLYDAANVGLALAQENEVLRVKLADASVKDIGKRHGDESEDPARARWLQEELQTTRTQLLETEQHAEELRRRLERTEAEQQDAERKQTRRQAVHEEAVQTRDREMEELRRQVAALEQDNRRLAGEKVALASRVKGQADEHNVALEQELHDALMHSEQALEASDARWRQAQEELATSEERVAILEEQLQTHAETQDELAHMHNEVARLQGELKDARQATTELQTQLTALRSNGELPLDVDDDSTDKDGRTLFSEVEDRRQALEEQHRQLNRRHRGLIRTHTLTVHSSEQMRQHISRLTHLSEGAGGGGGSTEERIARLERSLSQSLSEKRDLQSTIATLERRLAIASAAAEQEHATSAQGGLDDSVAWLRLRISQLETSEGALRSELQTLRFQKTCESDKLVKAEMQLGEREKRNEQLQASVARLHVELDDARMQVRLAKMQLQNRSTDLPITPGEAVASSPAAAFRDAHTQTEPTVAAAAEEAEDDGSDHDTSGFTGYVPSPHLQRIEARLQRGQVKRRRKSAQSSPSGQSEETSPVPKRSRVDKTEPPLSSNSPNDKENSDPVDDNPPPTAKAVYRPSDREAGQCKQQ